MLDWVRSQWQHRQWVDERPEATAVAGHSRGAILAAQVAAARPAIAAYVSWSGVWGELADVNADPVAALQAIDAPSFFMWSSAEDSHNANLDFSGRWDAVPAPKYRAVFAGEHFDYLAPQPGCEFRTRVCSVIEPVAAELSALFIARHVPGNLARAQIPASLDFPEPALTPQQEFFWGGHLRGLEQIRTASAPCGVDLAWQIGPDSGSRHLGA